ncbi:MAG: serpin family protein [Deltaproteobacteria bacterium]|jgi:serpin B|nr:serpin family protein [Deltaproteobacteria bacterium]
MKILSAFLTILMVVFFSMPLAWGEDETTFYPPDDEGLKSIPGEVLEISVGNNTFALDLYGSLKTNAGNIFISPLSISGALAMVYAGAKGETAVEFEKTLHFPFQGEELAKAFEALTAEITPPEGGPELYFATSIWPQQGEVFNPIFLETLKKYYHSEIEPVDFRQAEALAREKINNWVSEKTNTKIQDFLSNPLPADTNLLLVSAVYFKGKWKTPFEQSLTADGDFFVGDSKVTFPFMKSKSTYGYIEFEGTQILELPYVGNKISMVIILPKKEKGAFGKLEQNFTIVNWQKWWEELRSTFPKTVNVTIPKFSLTYGTLSIRQNLVSLGLKLPFMKTANFSGVSDTNAMTISDVYHKTFVEVNEEGTEAAAATGIGIRATSLEDTTKIPIFLADHPFIFLIADNDTGNILFLGRLNPQPS